LIGSRRLDAEVGDGQARQGVLFAVLSIAFGLVSGGASAQLLGTEFQVNTTTTLDQRVPAVAFDGTGNFVINYLYAGRPAPK
jgi:hypothetical protein